MRKTVIEISVVAETEGDQDADRIGQAVVKLLHLRRPELLSPNERLLLARVEQVTVANIDHDFLNAPGDPGPIEHEVLWP